LVAGGFSAGAAGGDGDLGGVEELARLGGLEDLDDEAVGDAGDEGVDGIRVGGQEGHGVAVGPVDALEGFGAVVVAGVVEVAGFVVGVDAALYGEFGCDGHGGVLSWEGWRFRETAKERNSEGAKQRKSETAKQRNSETAKQRNSDLGKRKGPPGVAGGPWFFWLIQVSQTRTVTAQFSFGNLR
jgi:hypothetical protein